MTKQTQTLFVLLLGFALVLTACGGDGGSADATPLPTDTPTPLPASSGAGPASLDLDDPETYKPIPGDYTLNMDFRFEGQNSDGTDASGSMLMVGNNQADPPAFSMDATVSGVADLGGVDHVIYANTGGQIYFWNAISGCITLPDISEQGELFNNIVDTGGFLTGTAQRVQPDETINGVPSYHYAIGPENLDTTDPESMEVAELTSGDLYIAQGGGYVVRLVLEGVGVSQLLSAHQTVQGDIYYQLDFEPAPGGVTVTLPEGCEEGESPEVDYPLLDDAYNVTSFPGFFSYQTKMDIETAVDFYVTQMAAAGWTLEDNSSVGGIAGMEFSMGSRTVSIVMTPSTDGALSILIAEEN